MFTVVVAETANIYMHACKQIVTGTHGAFLDSWIGILAEESLHRLDRRLLESLLRKVLLARIWRQNTNSKCVNRIANLTWRFVGRRFFLDLDLDFGLPRGDWEEERE